MKKLNDQLEEHMSNFQKQNAFALELLQEQAQDAAERLAAVELLCLFQVTPAHLQALEGAQLHAAGFREVFPDQNQREASASLEMYRLFLDAE